MGILFVKVTLVCGINFLESYTVYFIKTTLFIYHKQSSRVQWSVNFQKYVVRILKKFPRDDYYCYRMNVFF